MRGLPEPPPLLRSREPLGEDCRGPGWWLAAITTVAAVLRLHDLGSELWLDEIVTVFDSRQTSFLHLITTFQAAGRHVLHSLAVKASIGVFGVEEWAVRLPAAIQGIAGIPAVYLLARTAFHRRESLLVAALLATSYHHVFFSQNARGYSGLLLWSMLGTAFFLRALQGGGWRSWTLYVVTMLVASATMLLSFFLIAGHVLAFAVACRQARRQGRPLATAAGAAVAAWTILGLLCLLFYAGVVSAAWAYVGETYTSRALGFAPFSAEHLREWAAAAAAAFGAGGLAAGLAAATLGLAGGVWLLVKRPVFTLTLTAPLFLLAGYKLAAGLRFSPRFFIWALPVAYLLLAGTAALAGSALRDATGRRRIAAALPLALTAVLASASLISLERYYRVPKQPNRQGLEWILERRAPGELIAGAYLAKWGLRFYGPRAGLREGTDFVIVHTADELAALEDSSAEKGHRAWVLTTFPRALRVEYPDLVERLESRYEPVHELPATVGDAGVRIWRLREESLARD